MILDDLLGILIKVNKGLVKRQDISRPGNVDPSAMAASVMAHYSSGAANGRSPLSLGAPLLHKLFIPQRFVGATRSQFSLDWIRNHGSRDLANFPTTCSLVCNSHGYCPRCATLSDL